MAQRYESAFVVTLTVERVSRAINDYEHTVTETSRVVESTMALTATRAKTAAAKCRVLLDTVEDD